MADKPGPKPLRPDVEANADAIKTHARGMAILKSTVEDLREKLEKQDEALSILADRVANPELSEDPAQKRITQAFDALCRAIRTENTRYRRFLSAARQFQGGTVGPLTDLIEAIRSPDFNQGIPPTGV